LPAWLAASGGDRSANRGLVLAPVVASFGRQNHGRGIAGARIAISTAPGCFEGHRRRFCRACGWRRRRDIFFYVKNQALCRPRLRRSLKLYDPRARLGLPTADSPQGRTPGGTRKYMHPNGSSRHWGRGAPSKPWAFGTEASYRLDAVPRISSCLWRGYVGEVRVSHVMS